jgi:hypothetical protein
VRHDVVGAVRDVAGPERVCGTGPADGHEVDLLDARVGVAPARADELRAGVALQVDDRVGPARQELGRARYARGAVCGHRDSHRYASTSVAENASMPTIASS